VSERTLLLLDIDGVLVHPVGYKMALRATVNHFAAQMGLPEMGPDDEEIAIFEACGITNEWDSGAMCVSTIVLAALEERPDLRRDTLGGTLEAINAEGAPVSRPDYRILARTILPMIQRGQGVPAALHLAQLAQYTDAENLPLLAALLDDVYTIRTPTTQIFQNHTLGSVYYAETYGETPPLQLDSYLKQYDMPLLSKTNRERLVTWHGANGNGAAVFTARPSWPPVDLPERNPFGHAPEAELAAELLEIEGKIPLIGQGRIVWLAAQYGRLSTDYLKPAPVQALAAIGAAASHSEKEALEAAAELYETGKLSGPLAALKGDNLRVFVFEDATTGVRAARAAVERLRHAGLNIHFEAVGVSPHPEKQAALREVADHVVNQVNEGLALVFGN